MARPAPRHRAPKEPRSILNALQAFAVAGTAFSVVAVLSLLGGESPTIDFVPGDSSSSQVQPSAVVGSGSPAPTGVRGTGGIGASSTAPTPTTGTAVPPAFVSPGTPPTEAGTASPLPVATPAGETAVPPATSEPAPTTTTPTSTSTARPTPSGRPVTPGVPPVTPKPSRTR